MKSVIKQIVWSSQTSSIESFKKITCKRAPQTKIISQAKTIFSSLPILIRSSFSLSDTHRSSSFFQLLSLPHKSSTGGMAEWFSWWPALSLSLSDDTSNASLTQDQGREEGGWDPRRQASPCSYFPLSRSSRVCGLVGEVAGPRLWFWCTVDPQGKANGLFSPAACTLARIWKRSTMVSFFFSLRVRVARRPGAGEWGWWAHLSVREGSASQMFIFSGCSFFILSYWMFSY